MVKTKRPPQGEQKGIVLAPPQALRSYFSSGDGDSVLFYSPPQAPFFAALRAAAVCPNGQPPVCRAF